MEIFNQYARSELLILVPVLYVISQLLTTSKISNKFIPLIVSALSILLCGVYTFATVPINGAATILLALFTSVTQGVLFAGASILGKIIINPECFTTMLNKNDENDKSKKE